MTTTAEIAGFLDAQVGIDVLIEGVSTASHPLPNTLAFITTWADDRPAILASAPSTLFLLPENAPGDLPNGIRVANPRLEFARIGTRFLGVQAEVGVHPTSVVSSNARIADDAAVGPFVVIEDEVEISGGTVVASHVTLHRGVRIGRNCVIGSHSSIGNVGFGLERDPDGKAHRLPHLGAVVVGDEVEMGSHVSIARGTIDDTMIEDGAKIDNHVFIAHNAHIGAGAYLIAGSLICGSAVIGARSWIAPGAVVKNKVTIGDDATVGLGAVVVRNVEAGTTVAGVPARPLGS